MASSYVPVNDEVILKGDGNAYIHQRDSPAGLPPGIIGDSDFEKQRRPIDTEKLVIQSVLVVILVAIAATLSGLFFSTDRGYAAQASGTFIATESGEVTPGQDAEVIVQLLTVDVQNMAFTVRAGVTSIPDSFVDSNGTSAKGFSLFIGEDELQLKKLSFKSLVTSVDFTSGSQDLYPFDKYESLLYVSVVSNDPEIPRPGIVVDMGSQYQFGLKVTLQNAPEESVPGVAAIRIKVSRAYLTQIYPFFIMILLLAFGTMAFVIASLRCIWQTARKVEPPVMAIFVPILFAIPTLRKTAPGSPVFGCAFDVLSTNMALIMAITSMVFMWVKYSVQK